MFWGKSIFPTFAVNAPMPSLPAEKASDELPVEIKIAICDLHEAIVLSDYERTYASALKVNKADRALEAVILKHLRGEADV